MSSNSRLQMESWLKTIDVECANVLDVGGSQLPIKGRVRTWKDNFCHTLDLINPHEAKAPVDIVWDMNMEHKAEDNIIRQKYYDVVFCLEVMEYIYNPLVAFKTIYNAMRNGGHLYVSFHFVYPIHKPTGTDLLRYTRFGAEKLLTLAGFQIKEVIPRKLESPGLLQAVYTNEKMRPDVSVDQDEVGYLIHAIKK